ncbi:MAG: peptidoglycan DD-metalloendopeptidase family protein [Myxococcota bacterium]
MRARLLTSLLLLALPVAHAAQVGRPAVSDEKEVQDELSRLIHQMEEKEAALREIIKQEKSVTRALGELDESIARMDEQAARLDAASVNAERKMKESEVQAARLTGELEAAEAKLTRRLRVLMRLGPAADIQVMLGSRSLSDLIWRRALLRRVAASDAALVSEVDRRRSALLQERRELLARRDELTASRAELERARKAAASIRAARAQTLMELGNQRGAAQRRIDELKAARRRLGELVEDLPASPTATGFAALKGHLPWPTAGEVDIPFGPRLDEATGVTTQHGGISVVAPLGQKVVAVASGRVVHAGWLRGFGQIIILDHGGGFHTLMAHLSRVTVQTGDEVQEGDVVAFVGDSESLRGPRLYFELRAKGRPVDPQRWLKP